MGLAEPRRSSVAWPLVGPWGGGQCGGQTPKPGLPGPTLPPAGSSRSSETPRSSVGALGGGGGPAGPVPPGRAGRAPPEAVEILFGVLGGMSAQHPKKRVLEPGEGTAGGALSWGWGGRPRRQPSVWGHGACCATWGPQGQQWVPGEPDSAPGGQSAPPLPPFPVDPPPPQDRAEARALGSSVT